MTYIVREYTYRSGLTSIWFSDRHAACEALKSYTLGEHGDFTRASPRQVGPSLWRIDVYAGLPATNPHYSYSPALL